MRRFGIVIGIIVAVVIVAVAVFALTFNMNRYRGTIQSQLEQRLARNVTLGDMRLGLFPPRFRVQNLAISDDPNFGTEKPFVQAQQLDVVVSLSPLLKGNVQIDSLDLQRPSVELIQNQQGIWNFSSLGGPSLSSSPDGHQFALAKLAISDGQVAVTDLQHGSPRAVYDHIDATILDFAPDKQFSIDVAAHLPGPGTQEVRLQGQGGPIVQGHPAATAFHGNLNLNRVEIAGLQKFLASPALANSDGIISGQTTISSESGKVAANGNMNVQNPRLDGNALGYPISAEYDITDDVATDVITIRNASVMLGTTPILFNGTVDMTPTPPKIDLRMRANNISIAEVAKLAAASGAGFAPGITVAGNVSADIQARGGADKPALNGTISGSDVQISGKGILQPVKVNPVNLTLMPSEIRSDNFNVTSGGTTLAAQFTLRQYLAKSPLVDATLRASNAALPEVLSMAKAYGITGLDNVSGAGSLSMDMRAAGPIQALSSADVVKAVNGKLNLNLNNMRYTGIDIGHQLASIGGFVNPGERDQGFTNISRITGNVIVKNGIAQTSDLLAQLDIGTVGATGTGNLVSQSLDLRANAVLSKDFSQRVGGTGIGGYLSTALSNDQGELVVPAIIMGTFQNPKFTPDLQKVAQMKLKGLVPNSNNPLGGAAGILGSLLGSKGKNQAQPQAQQAPQQQQPNPVQQILDIFGTKKKQQQDAPPK